MRKYTTKPLDLISSRLTKEDWRILKSLSNPKKIQDFLNQLPFNFERQRETNRSPALVIKKNKAHCFEGALLAAASFWIHGRRPLLLDLTTVPPDFDHVVALFMENGRWGAVSKTNHAVLRYREPVYKNVRELAMSYFHEYFLNDGFKTMRGFSDPFDLSSFSTKLRRFDNAQWIATKEDLYELTLALDNSPHHPVLLPGQERRLRRADEIERKASLLTEYKKW